MAGKSGVTDTDKGYKALVDRVGSMGKMSVSVGILEGPGAAPHGDTTVLDVATINEFGLGVPERSFLRGWYDENQQRAAEAMQRLLLSVVQGQRTKEQALNLFGLWVQGEIQKRIAAGIAPANAESTVAKKGSSTPLIDVGQLRSAMTFEVK